MFPVVSSASAFARACILRRFKLSLSACAERAFASSDLLGGFCCFESAITLPLRGTVQKSRQLTLALFIDFFVIIQLIKNTKGYRDHAKSLPCAT